MNSASTNEIKPKLVPLHSKTFDVAETLKNSTPENKIIKEKEKTNASADPNGQKSGSIKIVIM
jgi:hypothetical protein